MPWTNRIRGALRALPWGGLGFLPSPDPDLDEVCRWSAERFWLRFPPGRRAALKIVNRIAWPFAAVSRVYRVGWSWELLRDCLASGARPAEAWIWRRFFPGSGTHPMPGGAMGYIGDPSDHRLLGDKVATAALLRGVGIPVPNEFDPGDGRTWSSPGALFVKPRFGRGGRGTFTVDIVPGGRCRVEGKQVVTVDEFRATLRAAGGQPLVQERLFSCSELSDLATGGVAPVLRISTARTPGGEPFFHSAHISVRVPGERKLNFIRSHMRAAVDCDGLMSVAVWFAEPAKRYSSLPWNGAAILGRRLPGVPCAIRLALSAMSLFPGLAVISWDLILTAKGPVVLEGNSCGEWILLNFDLIVGKRLEAAGKLLRLWCETSVSEGAGKSGQAKAPNAT